jgi:hypothetical protein
LTFNPFFYGFPCQSCPRQLPDFVLVSSEPSTVRPEPQPTKPGPSRLDSLLYRPRSYGLTTVRVRFRFLSCPRLSSSVLLPGLHPTLTSYHSTDNTLDSLSTGFCLQIPLRTWTTIHHVDRLCFPFISLHNVCDYFIHLRKISIIVPNSLLAATLNSIGQHETMYPCTSIHIYLSRSPTQSWQRQCFILNHPSPRPQSTSALTIQTRAPT